MDITLADITMEDVVEHIANSLDNTNSNYYVDDEGFSWNVRAGYCALVVEITDPEGTSIRFRMTPMKD